MSNKLVLVGADNHVTSTQSSKVGKRRFRHTYYRVTCSCHKHVTKWFRYWWQVEIQAEVHARLWHGAEPDRGKWRNPNVEVA